jgi:hypothetical protein
MNTFDEIIDFTKTNGYIPSNFIIQMIEYIETTEIENLPASYLNESFSTLTTIIDVLKNTYYLNYNHNKSKYSLNFILTCIKILQAIEDVRKEIYLDQSDYLLIIIDGDVLIKLKNKLNKNSGRSIYIDIKAIKDRFKKQSESFNSIMGLGNRMNINLADANNSNNILQSVSLSKAHYIQNDDKILNKGKERRIKENFDLSKFM